MLLTVTYHGMLLDVTHHDEGYALYLSFLAACVSPSEYILQAQIFSFMMCNGIDRRCSRNETHQAGHCHACP